METCALQVLLHVDEKLYTRNIAYVSHVGYHAHSRLQRAITVICLTCIFIREAGSVSVSHVDVPFKPRLTVINSTNIVVLFVAAVCLLSVG